MKLYNFVSTTIMVVTFPIWMIGFLIGFLFRPLMFGIGLGYTCVDMWKMNVYRKQAEKQMQDKIRQQALEQLIRTGQLTPQASPEEAAEKSRFTQD